MRYFAADTDPETGDVVVVGEFAVKKDGESEPQMYAETHVGTSDHFVAAEDLRKLRGGSKALVNWRAQNDEPYEKYEQHFRENSIRGELEFWAEVGREPKAIELIERNAPFEEIEAYYNSGDRPRWWTTEEEREAVHRRLEAWYASGRTPAG